MSSNVSPKQPPRESPSQPDPGVAWRAWQAVGRFELDPQDIVPLKQHSKSQVFRLRSLDPRHDDVVAKRCRAAAARVEQLIYEQILPALPVASLRYHGALPEAEGEFTWLFLDAAAGDEPVRGRADHRSVIGRWLGLLHGSAAGVVDQYDLGDVGSNRYLAHLRASCRQMEQARDHPALTAADRRELQALTGQCRHLEEQWGGIEARCAAWPQTLVHGDLAEKNMRLTSPVNGSSLGVYDWATAGVGSVAVDLAQPTAELPRLAFGVDLKAYRQALDEAGVRLSEATIVRAAEVGGVLRLLAAMDWASHTLRLPLVARPMRRLRAYHQALVEAMRQIALM